MTESEMKSLLSFGASRGRSYGTVDRYRVDFLIQRLFKDFRFFEIYYKYSQNYN